MKSLIDCCESKYRREASLPRWRGFVAQEKDHLRPVEDFALPEDLSRTFGLQLRICPQEYVFGQWRYQRQHRGLRAPYGTPTVRNNSFLRS